MQIKESFLDKSKYSLKCPYEMNPIGIVIHNTANDAPAKNEASYAKTNSNSTGFHIVVDDIEAIQIIPFNRNAFANGDGRTGTGNRKYISLEICYSKSGGTKFTKAEQNSAKVVAQLLKKYGWTINNVKAHRDFSGKNCPHRTNMTTFKQMVEKELKALNTTSSNTNTTNEEIYYRVVVGSFKSKDEATKLQAKAIQAGFTGAFLTTFKK